MSKSFLAGTGLSTSQSGSLLIELALVLVVTGATAAMAFSAISDAGKTRERGKADVAMAVAEKAIRAFALREKRLPCPDVKGQGYEGLDADGLCPDALHNGKLPYVALNMEQPVLSDGGTLHYGMAHGLSNRAMPDRAAQDAAFGTPAAALDADGSQRFITQLIDASRVNSGRNRTMLAGLDKSEAALDCSEGAGEFPAFAVSAVVVDRAGWCFSDAPDGGARALSVGQHEFLGWVQARLQ